MIAHEDERLVRSTGKSLRVTRRALLARVAALAAVCTVSPWEIGVPSALGATAEDPRTIQTLEAFADTLIPGQKRFPNDRAIAGAARGPGAVQAGAIQMMNFKPIGAQQALPGLALILNLYALLYALSHKIKLDLTVPPFVALDFRSRTALLLSLLAEDSKERPAFFTLASLSFAAYHTAAYLPTTVAIRNKHPGLAAIRFPPPNADGLWRFPSFSYRRVLARPHPNARGGNPP